MNRAVGMGVLLISHMGPFLTFLAVVGFALWLYTLVSHLRRSDLTDTDRIVWTVVLCTLNILGMILYWAMVPAVEAGPARSEKELKEFFNTQAD